jgi:hypothetical protein
MAYYAASQILVMMVEQHGTKKLARMLELWGQGQRTTPWCRVRSALSRRARPQLPRLGG